ncbi:MAG: SDR family NAD(P)-dependent oxidoreductase [Aggregatilineales bacterium]
MERLSGKVAIITGAASGMGLAAAQLFAKEGAKVVATDIEFDVLVNELKAITDGGGDAIALKQDVASPESWKQVVDQAIAKYGKIDILVNNAGIFVPKGILQEDLEGWNRLMSINCTGVWLGMKAVIPHMQQNGKGSIINCSSIAGLMGGDADAGGAAYSASKGAVRSMTKHAAQWFAKDNIRVNSVHPGAIFTGIAKGLGIPTHEELSKIMAGNAPLPPYAGEPLDIAYAYLYLASDEAKFVTGEELVIDGGWITH